MLWEFFFNNLNAVWTRQKVNAFNANVGINLYASNYVTLVGVYDKTAFS